MDEPIALHPGEGGGVKSDRPELALLEITFDPGSGVDPHFHKAHSDSFYVLEGEVVLVTDAGEEVLRSGDCAGFPAGVPDGHHLQNRSTRAATVIEIGTRRPEDDEAFYPDIDLHALKGSGGYAHRDGRPYRGDGT